jgi:hypothetical protein
MVLPLAIAVAASDACLEAGRLSSSQHGLIMAHRNVRAEEKDLSLSLSLSFSFASLPVLMARFSVMLANTMGSTFKVGAKNVECGNEYDVPAAATAHLLLIGDGQN